MRTPILTLSLLLLVSLTSLRAQNTKLTYKRPTIDNPTEINSELIIDDPFVSWENPIEFQGSLISIEPGATLEIKNTLELGNSTQIIVKPGGTLILDGGTLTSAGEHTWAGIEVWGDPDSPFPDDQGKLVVKNGALIENAEVAIRNHDPIPEPNQEGGVIEATGSNFKNNIKTVDIRNYNYKSHIRFKDCKFVYSEDYPGSGTPGYFMEIRVMEDVVIESCDFTNNTSENHVGRGILSYASQVMVNADCTSPTQPCTDWDNSTFTNLEYGIYALGAYGTRFISVEHAAFDDNFRGMYISGMSNAVVTDNNFEVNTMYETGGGYGLYLDNSTGYKVEENNFYHYGAVLGVGLIVNESGGKPNMIYRNYFTQLECGMDIQGVNRDLAGNGLVLKCNQYEGTLMDKIITYDEATVRGVAHNQGSSGSNPEDMAGNLFQIDGQTPNGDFDDILNEGNSIVYYWPQNNNNSRVRPVDITDNVYLEEETVEPDDWTYDNGCPPTEVPGGGGIGVIKGKMAEAEQKIDSTENLLSILIDGGNTEVTQTDVNNSIPPETMEVYNDLMAKSPYLSDTVVSAAIEKEDVLPGAMIRDIMVANPKAAKSEKLMEKLDERWDPLPDYMKGQILAGRSIVSIREETESRLAAFKLERAKHFNAIVGYYLNDTIDPAGSMDSLLAFYENEDSPGAKYSLAFLSGELGAWGEGLVAINNIPVLFELSAKETAEHLQMLDYYNLLSGLAQEGKSILEADSSQMATLSDMEESLHGMASIYARNVLLALNQMEYDEPIILPDMLKSSAAMEEYNYLLGKANDAPGYIKVKPNPAKDYIILTCDLAKASGAKIDIHNINAKLKFTKNLINRQDQFAIDTRKWNAGVYVITLKINGKLVENDKFTVIK